MFLGTIKRWFTNLFTGKQLFTFSINNHSFGLNIGIPLFLMMNIVLMIFALMLSQSISSPEMRWFVRKMCACEINVYELQVNFWTWKFSHTDGREWRFLPNDLPQCGSSDCNVLPLSHMVCIYMSVYHANFWSKFSPSLSLTCCQGLANHLLVDLFQNLCHCQQQQFAYLGVFGKAHMILKCRIRF